MAWALYAFPFVDSHREYDFNVESLRDCGIEPPVPASAAPTAAQLRDAMTACGCESSFWPDADSWFYRSADYEKARHHVVDGIHVAWGYVGAVGVQFEHKTGGVDDWDGDWSDELSFVSFDRPDAGAALLVVWELARQHGPVVVMAEGDVAVTVARGDESFGEFYRVTDESLFDDD